MSLSEKIRIRSYEIAGGSTSDKNYDPLTLDLMTKGAEAVELLESLKHLSDSYKNGRHPTKLIYCIPNEFFDGLVKLFDDNK